jgi:hypothetical protein
MVAGRTWTVPGYEAEELIGFGSCGEVWRGRSLTDDAPVVLKRLYAADEAAFDRLRREAELLGDGSHPHLLPVRDVVRCGSVPVLVLDHAPGGSLAALLGRRGRLRAGEVVTVVVPLATTLAQVHAAGLVHGAVTPGNVLFAADGRPLLSDLGVARAVGRVEPAQLAPAHADPAVARGGPPVASTDVFMLAAVAAHALTGRPPWSGATAGEMLALAARGVLPDLRWSAPDTPEALVETLERALVADPRERPTAGELALDIRHACVPEPVRLLGPPAAMAPADPEPRAMVGPRHRKPAPARRWRTFLAARPRRFVAGVLAVVALSVVGVARVTAAPTPPAAGPPAAAPVAGDPAGASDDGRWAQAIERLDGIRATAYERGDVAMLARVWAPGPRLRADSAQLRTLVAQGCTATGVRHRFGEVALVSTAAGRVRLRVLQWLPESRRRCNGGATGALPGSPPSVTAMDLVATPDGWRLA